MRRWFKVNQNKLYRKYAFDPHGFIIRKAKITKAFKFLLLNFKYKYFKKNISSNFGYGFPHKKRFCSSRRFFYNKHLRRPSRKDFNKNCLNKYKKNLKLQDWRNNFWTKFKYNYFDSKKKNCRKLFIKNLLKKKKVKRWKKVNYLRYRMIMFIKKKKKRIKKHAVKIALKNKRKKLLNRLVWLKIGRIRKRKKTWWLLRINLKKTAYFYGIKKLQKFRYINSLFNKAMGLNFYSACRLECMLNMILFRLNIFDNIYIINNFIRTCSILVNKRRVTYPFRLVKVNEVIVFQLSIFKKIFNIFVKRAKFNRSFLLKKFRKKYQRSRRVMHLVKNFINVPPYIEYNYKILHFVIWRLPNRKEFLGAYFKCKNTYDWDLDTQLKYN